LLGAVSIPYSLPESSTFVSSKLVNIALYGSCMLLCVEKLVSSEGIVHALHVPNLKHNLFSVRVHNYIHLTSACPVPPSAVTLPLITLPTFAS